MNGKALQSQQLNTGPVVGNPGQSPDASCATGISDAAREKLERYANPTVKQYVLDTVDRKRGGGVDINKT